MDVHPKKKLMMVGTPDEQLLREPSLDELPDVFNDLDVDYHMHPEEILDMIENEKKVKKIALEVRTSTMI